MTDRIFQRHKAVLSQPDQPYLSSVRPSLEEMESYQAAYAEWSSWADAFAAYTQDLGESFGLSIGRVERAWGLVTDSSFENTEQALTTLEISLYVLSLDTPEVSPLAQIVAPPNDAPSFELPPDPSLEEEDILKEAAVFPDYILKLIVDGLKTSPTEARKIMDRVSSVEGLSECAQAALSGGDTGAANDILDYLADLQVAEESLPPPAEEPAQPAPVDSLTLGPVLLKDDNLERVYETLQLAQDSLALSLGDDDLYMEEHSPERWVFWSRSMETTTAEAILLTVVPPGVRIYREAKSF